MARSRIFSLLAGATLSLPIWTQAPAPSLDGVLRPKEWGEPVASRLFRYAPSEEGEPSADTRIYIRQDSKALYFAFECRNPAGAPLWAPLTRRDQAMHGSSPSDGVVVYLDTTGTGRYQYFFGVNPRGVQEDGIAQNSEDTAWDGIWDSVARIDGGGWVVEMRIPFSTLRFARETKRWFVSFGRIIAALGEFDVFPRQSRDIQDFTKQALVLSVDAEGPYGERAFLPYLSYRDSEGLRKGQLGADLIFPGPGNAIANVTIHPDFGQVEADVPQFDINNRFPLFYPEKRPFFLEQSELFSGMPITAFHSRRILNPSFGTRLTGKTGKSSSTLLYARESHDPTVEGSMDADDVVARATQELYAGSYLGGTLLYRGGQHGVGGENYAAGLDGRLRFGGPWTLALAAFADRDRDVVSGRDSRGAAGVATLSYGSKTLNAYLSPFSYSTSFRLPLGFIPRNDFQGANTGGSYTLWLNRPSIASVITALNLFWAGDGGGQTTDRKGEASILFDLGANNSVSLARSHYIERWNGADHPQDTTRIQAMWWSHWLVKLGASVTWGDQLHYGTSQVGSLRRQDASLLLTPASWLRFDLTAARERLSNAAGGLLYDVNLFYLKSEWTLGPAAFLRWTTSWASDSRRHYQNLLFGWVRRPGDGLYISASSEKDPTLAGGRWQRGVYLKFGRRFDF